MPRRVSASAIEAVSDVRCASWNPCGCSYIVTVGEAIRDSLSQSIDDCDRLLEVGQLSGCLAILLRVVKANSATTAASAAAIRKLVLNPAS